MSIYEKPTKELMREWATNLVERGKSFRKSEPIEWFKVHYPKIKSNTVAMHVEVMATNNGNLRRHHPSVHANSNHDLFFKLGPGLFRLFDERTDPAPEYDGDSGEQRHLLESDAENNEDEIVKTLDADTLSKARAFAYERDLQNFLVKNLELIEPGLHLYRDPDEEIVGVEYDVGGRRIDILALDSEGTFVVIELKVSKGYDRVVGQIARYMAWIQKNLTNGKAVRGIIIANEISEDLKLATSLVPGVELVEYRMSFEVQKVSATQVP